MRTLHFASTAIALTIATLPAEAGPSRVLSLAEAETLASSQQPQVLLAHAQTRLAEGQAEQSRAPLLPQITGTAQYVYVARQGAIPNSAATTISASTSTSATRSHDYYNFGLNASQQLYDFGQTIERFRAAEMTVDAQRSSEHAARLTVLLNVRRAYFNARAMQALVQVAQETLDGQNTHLLQIQGMVQVGTQPAIALATQKASVANARVQLITAQNNYETAKAQLNQAMGVTSGTDYDLADEELAAVDGEEAPVEGLVASALSSRPEMASLARQRDAQEAAANSARGGYGPSLSATGSATESGLGAVLLPNWTAGLLLSWPILQGGLTLGQVRAAEANLASVDAQKALEELQIRLDVVSAQLSVRAAKAAIGAATDAVDSAHEQLRLAEQRYATGVGSIIELTDAQVAYSTAAGQLVQTRYQLSSARAQLLAALGRT